MDQDRGTSLVLINSDKGMALFDSIKNRIEWREFSLKDAEDGNPYMNKPLYAAKPNRKQFFEDLDKLPFEQVAKRHFPQVPSTKSAIIKKIKKPLRMVKQLLKDSLNLGLSYTSWKAYLKVNIFSKQVKRGKRFPLFNQKNTLIQLDKGAELVLNARLNTGEKQVKESKTETRILLQKNSQMIVDGEFQCFAGSFIRVTPNSKLILHGGFINENVQITAGDTIEIGKDFTCGRDVIIRSFDGHTIEREGFKISEPIIIGEHVWVGQGATILKGVTIGDGAIVASGAIVTKDVPAHSIVAGVPAKVVSENIKWHR